MSGAPERTQRTQDRTELENAIKGESYMSLWKIFFIIIFYFVIQYLFKIGSFILFIKIMHKFKDDLLKKSDKGGK